MATTAELKLDVTLAQAKMAAAQAHHPVRYDTNEAYRCGVGSPTQKYGLPALAMADASSDKVMPTQIETKANHATSYMVTTASPRIMSVMSEAGMLHQVFVSEKATPNRYSTENLRCMFWVYPISTGLGASTSMLQRLRTLLWAAGTGSRLGFSILLWGTTGLELAIGSDCGGVIQGGAGDSRG